MPLPRIFEKPILVTKLDPMICELREHDIPKDRRAELN